MYVLEFANSYINFSLLVYRQPDVDQIVVMVAAAQFKEWKKVTVNRMTFLSLQQSNIVWQCGYVSGSVAMSVAVWLCQWQCGYVSGSVAMSVAVWRCQWQYGDVSGCVAMSVAVWRCQ